MDANIGRDGMKREPVKILNPILRNESRQLTNSPEMHTNLAAKLRSESKLPRFTKELTLKMEYLRAILDGRKTVEGRINTDIVKAIRNQDYLLFFSGNTCALTQVTEKKNYDTFRQMLETHGVQSCLPGFKGDLEAAIQLYQSFPGYREKEAKFGVSAVVVELVKTEKLEKMLSQQPLQPYRQHSSLPADNNDDAAVVSSSVVPSNPSLESELKKPSSNKRRRDRYEEDDTNEDQEGSERRDRFQNKSSRSSYEENDRKNRCSTHSKFPRQYNGCREDRANTVKRSKV